MDCLCHSEPLLAGADAGHEPLASLADWQLSRALHDQESFASVGHGWC